MDCGPEYVNLLKERLLDPNAIEMYAQAQLEKKALLEQFKESDDNYRKARKAGTCESLLYPGWNTLSPHEVLKRNIGLPHQYWAENRDQASGRYGGSWRWKVY